MTNTGIARLTGKLNATNDPLVGQSVAGGQAYTGQLGAVAVLNADLALQLSDTTVGTLYAGKYQYVQFKTGQSGTTVKGGPVYWDDPDNFIVTADVPTGALGFSGVALNVVTKGNYGWILVEGKCQCQPLDNTTKSSPAVGDVMILSTIGRFDDVDDPYATGAAAALPAGQWIEAPADATSVRYLAYVKFACKNAS